eukprot:6467543-Amphidinium_carterae.1
MFRAGLIPGFSRVLMVMVCFLSRLETMQNSRAQIGSSNAKCRGQGPRYMSQLAVLALTNQPLAPADEDHNWYRECS